MSPRRVRFPAVVETPAAAEPVPTIGPVIFTVDLNGSPESIDLSGLPCPRLTRALASALAEVVSAPGTLRDRNGVRYVVKRIREFVEFTAAALPGSASDLRLSDLEPDLLDAFETRLIAQYGGTSKEPYLTMTYLVRLLKLVHEAHPDAFGAAFHARLGFTSASAHRASKPLDAYPFPVLDALENAARDDVARVRDRILEGENLAATGRDPRRHGWDRLENVLWYIANHGPLTVDDASCKVLRPLGGREELNGRLHLTARDLVPFLLLLACQTGMEPECIRQLRSDCLASPARGYVSIAYVKKRAPGSTHKTVRITDGGSLRFPGGVIRLALRLTKHTRELIDSDALWCDVGRHGQARASFDGPQGSAVSRQWMSERGLDRLTDRDGGPVALDLRRVRKTVKSRQYLRAGGVLEDFASGHTRPVAAKHYADIGAHEETHEQAVEAGLEQALGAALSPPVVLSDDGDRLDDGQAALTTREIESALSGEQDVWLASCRDFFASPFARKPGAACPVPAWGCLECPNAVFTSRHLPSLLSFLDFLERQREEYPAAEWTTRFGLAWDRIVHGVRARFSTRQIATAQVIAEGGGDRLLLPASFLEVIA
ncbi:hypothetical protein BJP40_17700 [Streptomyces sp. CC53]|uniref:hypothetical protein n=1 Tax=Streptomyces sp. CC53 TaxID=1906740 RepID=UPI0008DC6391|nr:hypothetical protein [Streptomyces sp. CC53]OII65212.1 hypothetical protein BJP40_17700 [Streptomyces sp. CC53]